MFRGLWKVLPLASLFAKDVISLLFAIDMNDSAVSRNLFYKISMRLTMRQTATSHYVIAL